MPALGTTLARALRASSRCRLHSRAIMRKRCASFLAVSNSWDNSSTRCLSEVPAASPGGAWLLSRTGCWSLCLLSSRAM
eukprot:scaffold46328_cov28-Tisochrysis_lutea.AAC.2